MALTADPPIELPPLPAKHEQFIEYIAARRDKPLAALLEPYQQYDAELRKVFAQQPDHPAAQLPNYVPVFAGHEAQIKVRARDLQSESEDEKQRYIMPLSDHQRKPDGSRAIATSLREFRAHFNIFSESALVGVNFSNIVAAGSSVVTPLLAVPPKHAGSRRALRQYYHEQLAPASDVDLFMYGLDEEQAKEKIKEIEQSVRDAILSEVTTVRTKNAVTIVSQYPVRHIQIVLRLYKNIAEILTGFDVDCSCAAYDGKQVYASPRAIVAYMTQINQIDLTRRSPSYENRLSKYAHRGFEVYWPSLDRSRVDPTIFERSFVRTEGLARLLVLEKLPKSADRDAYVDQRRAERGRPPIARWITNRQRMRGNIKADWEDEVAEWDDAEEVSNYHTFTILYGPKINARNIEKLLFKKDLLLNAEWNAPKDREVHLHRHPAFFGRPEDVFEDCCGFCPVPVTDEEKEVAEEEGKTFVSGAISFLRDNPGRQAIGSFRPLSPDDWTDMAYIGNTAGLSQAIIDGDLEYVQTWLQQEGNDPNSRDCTGRAPLHLAASDSTPEIVQCLIDHGARLIARLVDGNTALHLAAMRGNVEILSALLKKSEANEEEEERRASAKKSKRQTTTEEKNDGTHTPIAAAESEESDSDEGDEDLSFVDEEDASEDDDVDATTDKSLIKVRSARSAAPEPTPEDDKSDDTPDVYDVNIVAWDVPVAPLHLAIMHGHVDVVKCLVQQFGADVLLPVKLLHDDRSARGAILTLVLALSLPLEHARAMILALLELGATVAQADVYATTALHHIVATRSDLLETVVAADPIGVERAINTLTFNEQHWNARLHSPLVTAIQARDSFAALQLLAAGAKGTIPSADYAKALEARSEHQRHYGRFGGSGVDYDNDPPVLIAVENELPDVAAALIETYDADVNALTKWGRQKRDDIHSGPIGESLLDVVRKKIKALNDWLKREPFGKPQALPSDKEVLSEFKEGTYAHWVARQQLQQARDSSRQEWRQYEERAASFTTNTPAKDAKEQATRTLIADFERVEASLLARGAKTFEELHPDKVNPSSVHGQPHGHGYSHFNKPAEWTPPPFKVQFNFDGVKHTEVNTDMTQRQLKLFEAAWQGDVAAVKELTLMKWKSASSPGEEHPPLMVSMIGESQLTPLAIAVMRGHLDLAAAILEIALAQHARPDAPKQRYRLGHVDNESDADGEYDVYAEIVDEEFTIETIGEVSSLVHSSVSPVELLTRNYAFHHFVVICPEPAANSTSKSTDDPRPQSTLPIHSRPMEAPVTNPEQAKTGQENAKLSAINLSMFALEKKDLGLFNWLLKLQEHYERVDTEHNPDGQRLYKKEDNSVLHAAIRADDPHVLATLIKRTGAGIAFDRLAAAAGVDQDAQTSSKYYKGLNVRGKKRKDWAAAGRENFQTGWNSPTDAPLLLLAAMQGSTALVEWLLSDEPLQCYREFLHNYRDDPRLKAFSEAFASAKGGPMGCVDRLLSERADLAMHSCVLSGCSPELFHLLLDAMPEAVNAKSPSGNTPLLLAVEQKQAEPMQLFIDARADQTCRNKQGHNIVHGLLRTALQNNHGKPWLEGLTQKFELIDKRILPGLFQERSTTATGSDTPLTSWLKQLKGTGGPSDDEVALLQLSLQYSTGADLHLVNGQGDTPLHIITSMQRVDLAKVVLRHDPRLLLRENAVGRTPLDVLHEAEITRICSNAPPLPWTRMHNVDFTQWMAEERALPGDWRNDAINRHDGSFLTGPGINRTSQRRRLIALYSFTYGFLLSEGAATRRLVTLAEANEVAKRVAAVKRWTARRASSESDEEDEEQHLRRARGLQGRNWLGEDFATVFGRSL